MIVSPHFSPYPPSIPTSDHTLVQSLDQLPSIDDLSKYNIIQYVYHHPDAYGDAAFYARELGFHSIEQTQIALGSLRAAGILSCWGNLYGRSYNHAIWAAIAYICNLDPKTDEYHLLIKQLAQRSARRKK